MATRSALPSHLKPSSAANGSSGDFEGRHHGKSQSHVVSSCKSSKCASVSAYTNVLHPITPHITPVRGSHIWEFQGKPKSWECGLRSPSSVESTLHVRRLHGHYEMMWSFFRSTSIFQWLLRTWQWIPKHPTQPRSTKDRQSGSSVVSACGTHGHCIHSAMKKRQMIQATCFCPIARHYRKSQRLQCCSFVPPPSDLDQQRPLLPPR